MSDYQPKPGDKVHLTVEATVDSHGHYAVNHTKMIARDFGVGGPRNLAIDTTSFVWPEMPCIVRVEPAPVSLPVEEGSA